MIGGGSEVVLDHVKVAVVDRIDCFDDIGVESSVASDCQVSLVIRCHYPITFFDHLIHHMPYSLEQFVDDRCLPVHSI